MIQRAIRYLILTLALIVAVSPASRAQQGVPPPPPPPDPIPEPARAPQQDDQEPVQLGASLVNVPFNVSDKKGRLVTDVKKEEVEVLEDGKAQEIFSFERQLEAPLTIALLIDTSGSQEITIGLEREASSRFFQKVIRPDRDLASVLTFSKEVTLEQALTSQIAALDKALDRARVTPASAFGRGGTAPTNPTAGGTSLFDAVYLASQDVLRREAGRRAIILVTDGVDTTSSYNINAAIEQALRAEVIIYSIGIGDPRAGGIDTATLDKLSKETGGRTFRPRGDADLDSAFAEIENDLRQLYIVSYTPSNLQRDGSFRKIEVKLDGEARKDLRYRYRRGYYAPKG